MADVLTSLYAFVKQTIGGNRNTWGGILNSNFDKVEGAIAGVTSKVLSGGSYSLTDSERRNATLSITGVLTSKQTVVVQNIAGPLTVMNLTTGNFTLLLKTATGDPINIPRGCIRRIWCDGANNLYRDDAEQVGDVFHHAGTAVPPGALENTGATLLIADYPDLYDKVGTTYGGDGVSNFKIPQENDTGRFRRARTSSIVLGTKQANAFKTHTHTGSVTATGSATTGSGGGSHSHSFSGNTGNTSNGHTHEQDGAIGIQASAGTQGSASPTYVGQGNKQTGPMSADHTHAFSGTTSTTSIDHTHSVSISATGSFTTAATGDTETRPESIAYISCIRY